MRGKNRRQIILHNSFVGRSHVDTPVPPAECSPSFATDPVVEFGSSGASQPARRRGGSQLRAPLWVGQAKTAGPGCQSAGARPVRGEPKAEKGRRLSCSRPIRLSPSARERLPGLYCYSQPLDGLVGRLTSPRWKVCESVDAFQLGAPSDRGGQPANAHIWNNRPPDADSTKWQPLLHTWQRGKVHFQWHSDRIITEVYLDQRDRPRSRTQLRGKGN
jgi:hypothetical protein